MRLTEFFVRRSGAALVLLATPVALAVLIRKKRWRSGLAGNLLILLWCLPFLSVSYAHTAFWLCKKNVLSTGAAEAQLLGEHFIVGYSSFGEVAPLAEKVLIAGVYISRINVAGRSMEAVRSELSTLQARRRIGGFRL